MPGRASPLALCLALTLAPAPAAAQAAGTPAADTAALQRLLAAEDARGTGRDGLGPLLAASTAADTTLRRVAVRALGRLQRPELGRRLLPYLSDAVPSVRAEAANAVAQSLRGVKRDARAADSTRLTAREAAAALTRALASETDPAVVDALGQSLGRLPLPDSAAARAAEGASRARFASRATPGVAHGLYTLGRARRATGNLEAESVALLRRAAVTAPDTVVRRLALLTLAVAGGLDSITAVRAFRDRDDETRRMTLRGSGALSTGLRAALVRRGLADPSTIVRVEAVVAARRGGDPPDCAPILGATRDRDPYVALTAIDSLGGACADPGAAAAALRRLATSNTTSGPPDHRWQAGAHALLALARLDTAATLALLPRLAGSGRWEVRTYAARAAAVVGARPVLLRLAGDADHNVQEAAIIGLATTAGHEADSVYLQALGSSGNQVALAASEALKGSAQPGVVAALLDAFDGLSARRSENAKDPRVSLLERIGELGSTADAPRLRPYLADFDTTVAALAATTLEKWTGARVEARPVPLPIRAEPLAAVFLDSGVRLREVGHGNFSLAWEKPGAGRKTAETALCPGLLAFAFHHGASRPAQNPVTML